MPSLSTGDIVTDKEDDRPAPAVVVNLPPIESQNWTVNSDETTVADDNPSYDPTEEIAIVVFKSRMAQDYPKYTGKIPIKISKLAGDRTDFYAFPRSRLKQIGSLDPVEIPISQLKSNPYHCREFSLSGNEQFIEEIAERGHPDPIPLVRQTETTKFELISGHKRTWAAAAGGISKIYCDVVYMDDEIATENWAVRHLHEYTPEQQHESLRRIKDDYPDLSIIQ